MKLSSDILYNHLSQHVKVKYSGKHCDELSLTIPMFFYENMDYKDGIVYIGRAGELLPPPPKVSCLIVCVGGRIPSSWHMENSCTFSILSETDLFYVFNIISETFSRYDQWENDMRQILDGTADLAQMVSETADFFNCSIAVNDNQLKTICRTNQKKNSPDNYIEGNISPEEAKSFATNHHENISRREPFLYQTKECLCYCTNIYIHEVYWGLVTIECPNGAPTAGEKALYDYFYRLVYMTIRRLNRKENHLMITPKSIFLDLLNRIPVSRSKLSRISGPGDKDTIRWQCYAIQPGSSMENLPPEYFCVQIERRFPQCCAMPFGNYIVMFLPLHAVDREEKYYEEVRHFFEECDLHAGVSYPFSSLAKTHQYFRQAAVTLKAVSESTPEEALGGSGNLP